MLLSNLIRRRIHPLTVSRRHGSSSASTKRRPQRTLSDEKLNALVSLYHQSDNIITLDNLTQRIDEAFTENQKPAVLGVYTSSLKALKDELRQQRQQARVTEWDKVAARNSSDINYYNREWSSIAAGRELKVKHALHGLSDQRNLPGVEILKDAVENEELLERLEKEVQELESAKSPQIEHRKTRPPNKATSPLPPHQKPSSSSNT